MKHLKTAPVCASRLRLEGVSSREVMPTLMECNVIHCSCRLLSTDVEIFEDVMNVFDRNAKRKQRNRTALLDNYAVYDYIKDEVRLL